MVLSRRQKYMLCLKNASRKKRTTSEDTSIPTIRGNVSLNIPSITGYPSLMTYPTIRGRNIRINKPVSIEEYEKILINKSKSLTFNSTVRVILIPGIKDYENENLKQSLWYTQDEFRIFSKNYKDDMYEKYNSI